jgi:hypothetical protein
MYVLGIDPGITTGYALLEVKGAQEYLKIVAGVMKGYEGVTSLLSLAPVPEAYVIENFTLWPALAVKVSHDDPELLTVRYIGALTHTILSRGGRLVFQQPSYKKACPDFLLKKYGLWETRQTPHERDALRHVVAFTRREYATRDRERKKGASVRDIIEWQGGP